MMASLRLFLDYIDSPIGKLALVADAQGQLCAAGFATAHERMGRQLERYADKAVALVRRSNPGGWSTALTSYFAGDLKAIERLPVVFDGTAFQHAVWQALRQIPCGETWSYADLAKHIGRPRAVRAVGLANGANPIAVVVPCHRVIGSDGSLTGYGGGIERKRWLLDHEAAQRSFGSAGLEAALRPHHQPTA